MRKGIEISRKTIEKLSKINRKSHRHGAWGGCINREYGGERLKLVCAACIEMKCDTASSRCVRVEDFLAVHKKTKRLVVSHTSNCKIFGYFSTQNHHFSGAILYSFCIFDISWNLYCNSQYQAGASLPTPGNMYA